MKNGIICQVCGIEAPVRKVSFHQNIGMLIMRYSKSVDGHLCKSCINSKFWSMTLTTLAIGWLGMLSIILAPIFILNNLIQYLRTLSMPAVPPGAHKPQINEEMFRRFGQRADELFQRIERGEDVGDVCRSTAPQLNMTPGELLQCMITLSQVQKSAPPTPKPTGGFPVVQSSAPPPLPAAPAPAATVALIAPPPPAEEAPARSEVPTLGIISDS